MAKKLDNVETALGNLDTPEIAESDLGENLQEKKERLKKIKDKLDDVVKRADEL